MPTIVLDTVGRLGTERAAQARGEHRGNGVEVATREQAADLSHDARVDLLDVLVGGRRQWVKAKGAIGPLVLDPLGDQSMKM